LKGQAPSNGDAVRQFQRGSEWWGLRDDGAWIKWNRVTLEWDPQDEAPPAEEMEEIEAKLPAFLDEASAAQRDAEHLESFTRWDDTDPAVFRRSRKVEPILFLILMLIVSGVVSLVFRLIN
jgi:hypothetical protein